MKKTKHLLSILVVCAFAFLFYGSATNRGIQTGTKEPVKTPNYDYSPPEAQTKANLTLALVKPRFAKDMKDFNCKLFMDFSDHMSSDFEELITKRGFSLRGPFQQADDMVYGDKQSCYLYLQPEIEFSMDGSNILRHLQSTSTHCA